MNNTPHTDLPLHDTEAEGGALACVVQANGDAETYLSQLGLEHFYDARHQTIFRALKCLAVDRKHLGTVELFQFLKDKGQLEDAGGLEYVSTFPDLTPSPVNFPVYLETIQDRAERRALQSDAMELHRLASNPAISPKQLREAARRMGESYAAELASDKLTVRTPDDLLSQQFDECDRIIGDRLLAKGQSLVVAGAGSIGKSRLLLQMAVAVISGRPFISFETRGQELRWLIIQAENSNRRLQSDLSRLREWTGPKVWPRVNNQLVIHTLERECDDFMTLSNPDALRRIADLIREVNPDVIVFDSLYNFGIGDLNSDQSMSETLLTIKRLSKAGNPDRAVIVLHHARTGKAGAVGALGFDRSSFGRNSKVLHSWTRAQVNLAPGSPDSNDLLLVTCGKMSNGPEFPPFAVRLNQSTMIYEPDDSFDVANWQSAVSGSQAPAVTVELVRNLCVGKMSKAQLVKAVMEDTGCGKSIAYKMIDRAQAAKLIALNSSERTYVAR